MAVGSWMIGSDEHQLEAIAGRKDELLQLLLGRLRQDGRLLGEIDAGQILASAATAAPGRITLSRRALDRARRCRGRRLRCLSARRLRRRGRRLRDDGQTCRREDEGESNGGRAPGASCIRSGLHTIPFRSLRDIIQPVCRHILRRRPRSFTCSSPDLTSVVHLACSGDPDAESERRQPDAQQQPASRRHFLRTSAAATAAIAAAASALRQAQRAAGSPRTDLPAFRELFNGRTSMAGLSLRVRRRPGRSAMA